MRREMATCVVHRRADQIFNVLAFAYHASTIPPKSFSSESPIYISHQVIREYLANASRSQTYGPALSMDTVLDQIEDFRKSFYILSDSPAVLNRLLELARKVAMDGKQVHDANIVAVMLVNDIQELLTNNVIDFERYKAYIHVILLLKDIP